MTAAYRTLFTIRTLETRLQSYCDRGEAGDLHFSKGQEAIATGVCAALKPTDYIVTHHRTIAHAIAKGAQLYPLIAELLGKRTGYCQGRAGEMHISIPSIRYAYSFQLVGTCVPVATGLAWAMKYHHKTDDVVCVFFGDAASSNGVVHEALTIASLRRVPLLLVCENNGLAGNVRPEHYLPTPTVRARMAAYGISWAMADGNDVDHVRDAAAKAVEFVRESSRPTLLECHTHRLCFHKQGQSDLRSKAEIAELAKDDPLIKARAQLSAGEAFRIESIVNLEIEDAFARVAKDEVAEVVDA